MDLKLLKQKDFFILMAAKFVSLIGTQMQSFALSLYVLKITGSTTKFASVLAIALIPQLILGPVAGVFVDWLDRKKLIIYFDLASGISTAIFAFVYIINGKLSLGGIYILVILLSIISMIYQPAIGTVIPSIVKKEELIEATSINSLILNIGNLLAPALGGVLFGIYGLSIILVVNSISFVLSSIGEIFINIPKTNKTPEKFTIKAFTTDFNEGIKFIGSNKLILNIILMGLFVNFIGGPLFSIGLPFISKKILFVTDYQYGLVESIFVVSMLVAPIFSTMIAKKLDLGKIMFWDIFLTSIFTAVMSFIVSNLYIKLFKTNMGPYVSLLVLVFIIGVISTIGNIVLSTLFQKIVPLSMLGRVGTVMNTALMASMPLGNMVFGVLFDKLKTWHCFLLGAVILFIIILLFRKSFYSQGSTTDLIGNSEVEA